VVLAGYLTRPLGAVPMVRSAYLYTAAHHAIVWSVDVQRNAVTGRPKGRLFMIVN